MKRNNEYLWLGALAECARIGWPDVEAHDWFGAYDAGGEL